MATFGTPEEARAIAFDLIDTLQERNPQTHPMQVTGAVAIALGAMVASLAANGLTKEGRSGQLLKHLFKIAETEAEAGLEF